MVTARRTRPERRNPLTVHLLLVVLALLTLHATQPVHVHKGITPGAYNEEHVLSSLESTIGDVPLPDQTETVAIALIAPSSVVVPLPLVSSAVARLADSRAPPLA